MSDLTQSIITMLHIITMLKYWFLIPFSNKKDEGSFEKQLILGLEKIYIQGKPVASRSAKKEGSAKKHQPNNKTKKHNDGIRSKRHRSQLK